MNTLQVRCGASDSARGLPSASGLLTALALFFGMDGCLLSRIAAASEAIAPMIAGGCALILLSLLSKTRWGGKISFFCIIAGLVAALFALDLTGGLCAAFNRASAAMGARLAYNLPRLAASEEALPAALYAISILLAPILGRIWRQNTCAPWTSTAAPHFSTPPSPNRITNSYTASYKRRAGW